MIQLHQGDCLEILPTLEAGSIDAVVTDPPYGVDYQGRWNSQDKEIRGDRDTLWLCPLAIELHRLLPDSGFVVCFYGWPHAGSFLDAFREAGFRPTSHLCFIKNQVGLGYHTRGCHEQAYLFAKGKAKPSFVGPDVFGWTRCRNSKHPTQKPIDAILPLIRRFSRAGNTVLDPFMGSGTTGVACMRTDRDFIGIEIDPQYFAIAKRRIEAAQTPLFVEETA